MTTITRKVLAVGGSRAVALPKPWLDAWSITTGDEVELVLDETNSLIVIRPVTTP